MFLVLFILVPQSVIAAGEISSFPAVVDQVAGPLEIWDSCARNSGEI